MNISSSNKPRSLFRDDRWKQPLHSFLQKFWYNSIGKISHIDGYLVVDFRGVLQFKHKENEIQIETIWNGYLSEEGLDNFHDFYCHYNPTRLKNIPPKPSGPRELSIFIEKIASSTYLWYVNTPIILLSALLNIPGR